MDDATTILLITKRFCQLACCHHVRNGVKPPYPWNSNERLENGVIKYYRDFAFGILITRKSGLLCFLGIITPEIVENINGMIESLESEYDK